MNSQDASPQLIYLDETVSTNSYLRAYLAKEPLPEGSVVVAGYQTGGRGQTGNSWESAPGMNLLFSLVLYPERIPANRQFVISQIASLAVKETLDAYANDMSVKWPNDIYWQDKKICGILIENELTGTAIYRSIVGIGINLNQTLFKGNAPNPVSLALITGKIYDKQDVLDRFRRIFYAYYLLVLQEEYIQIKDIYMYALYRKEGYHPFSDPKGSFFARIRDIENTGRLLLQLESGEVRRYAFKEVWWGR
ncbi:MAG: biotin--[acetyl-CoA-carboxylase] ligase [Tannerellaceae bacterium]|jgi:BirA family biotin operon repressor/biotin-[acetyl-CoA-carboxylase] ligase|nr:biotin--[acetyl-CoA-carboxylase] ligase [Tannerellaceae bacterium]